MFRQDAVFRRFSLSLHLFCLRWMTFLQDLHFISNLDDCGEKEMAPALKWQRFFSAFMSRLVSWASILFSVSSLTMPGVSSQDLSNQLNFRQIHAFSALDKQRWTVLGCLDVNLLIFGLYIGITPSPKNNSRGESTIIIMWSPTPK